MAQLVVRDLDDHIKTRLKERAKRHGQSMEAEVRQILLHAIAQEHEQAQPLGTSIANRFRDIGLDYPIEEVRDWDINTPDFEP